MIRLRIGARGRLAWRKMPKANKRRRGRPHKPPIHRFKCACGRFRLLVAGRQYPACLCGEPAPPPEAPAARQLIINADRAKQERNERHAAKAAAQSSIPNPGEPTPPPPGTPTSPRLTPPPPSEGPVAACPPIPHIQNPKTAFDQTGCPTKDQREALAEIQINAQLIRHAEKLQGEAYQKAYEEAVEKWRGGVVGVPKRYTMANVPADMLEGRSLFNPSVSYEEWMKEQKEKMMEDSNREPDRSVMTEEKMQMWKDAVMDARRINPSDSQKKEADVEAKRADLLEEVNRMGPDADTAVWRETIGEHTVTVARVWQRLIFDDGKVRGEYHDHLAAGIPVKTFAYEWLHQLGGGEPKDFGIYVRKALTAAGMALPGPSVREFAKNKDACGDVAPNGYRCCLEPMHSGYHARPIIDGVEQWGWPISQGKDVAVETEGGVSEKSPEEKGPPEEEGIPLGKMREFDTDGTMNWIGGGAADTFGDRIEKSLLEQLQERNPAVVAVRAGKQPGTIEVTEDVSKNPNVVVVPPVDFEKMWAKENRQVHAEDINWNGGMEFYPPLILPQSELLVEIRALHKKFDRMLNMMEEVRRMTPDVKCSRCLASYRPLIGVAGCPYCVKVKGRSWAQEWEWLAAMISEERRDRFAKLAAGRTLPAGFRDWDKAQKIEWLDREWPL